jgi:hypothetical protein
MFIGDVIHIFSSQELKVYVSLIFKDFQYSTNQMPWRSSWMTGKVTRNNLGRRPQEEYHDRRQRPKDGKSSHKPLALVS